MVPDQCGISSSCRPSAVILNSKFVSLILPLSLRPINAFNMCQLTAVIARCGKQTQLAADAIKTWIERKQQKGKGDSEIMVKLEKMEEKVS
jgi:hypothetical protein